MSAIIVSSASYVSTDLLLSELAQQGGRETSSIAMYAFCLSCGGPSSMIMEFRVWLVIILFPLIGITCLKFVQIRMYLCVKNV
ncbi:hypothetical protein BRADI_1g76366v3 [Brachypodium distachyon]|uniref:Uncharacterized protein n=1 Tax=Brachypodium distachyon TaxID=15368 RepID=A0A2K2DVF5_BRADI|nr:hypothetical protein BRADI_1g76366v3 [Brachypodium distachyon]